MSGSDEWLDATFVPPSHIVKVICDEHPDKKSTIVQRFHLSLRPPTCEAAVRYMHQDGDAAVRDILESGLIPACADHVIADSVRPIAWCARCSGSTWRVNPLTAEEFLLDDRPVKRKYVTGNSAERPHAGTMRSVRHRFPLKCWCGSVKVDLRHEQLEKVLSDYADSGDSRVLLRDLAARVS